ncbi:unnamed protein product [Prorocentrum cordatum]|uniref:Pentatricopeptide repeat-containing protein n=1 Tax=Prorocentrum cordatum TaxID=2364126 RepID=A0ABN9U5Y8_9DINO|nr:unnamed protein product [Polarella glacialis]
MWLRGSAQVSYSAWISVCAKGEQWQQALAILSEMWEAKLEHDIVSYSAGVGAREKAGQWQRSLVLLSEMWEPKDDPDVINTARPDGVRARMIHFSPSYLHCYNQRVREG